MGIWGLLLLGGLLLLRGVVCAPRKVRAQLLGAVTLCVLTVGSAWAGTLDPRLAALMNQRASQTTNSAQPQSPSAPRIDSAGNVQVYIIPISPTAPLPSTDELAALGAVQVMPSDALHLVQAWVPITKLQALAALPDVGRVTVPAYGVPQHTQTSAPPSVSHKSLAGGSLGILALLALAGLTAARFFAPFRRCCSAAASQGWKTNS